MSYETLARGLRKFGGILRCEKCGREQGLGDQAAYLQSGWPRCHGSTMRWVTQGQLDEEEALIAGEAHEGGGTG